MAIRSCFQYRLIAAAIVMLPWSASAAGLGKMTLLSALGEPLRAEIELVSVQPDELNSLVARIAEPEAYRQANLQYPALLATARLSIESRSGGSHYIRVTSDGAVNEPFLDMLVELSWASGRLVREYTTLVDPPGYGGEPAAPVVAQQPAPHAKSPLPEVKSAPEAGPTVAESATPVPGAGENVYGPVKQGDTLGKIAHNLKPEDVSLDQMLVGLYRENKKAFAGNMSRLKTGQMLRVPEHDQLTAISSAEAAQEVRAQAADWTAYRQRLAAAAAPSAHEREVKQSASGKVTAQVEDLSAKADPKEVLKLSKSEQSGAGTGTGGSAENALAAAEEEIASKENAVQEANERAAMLQKNVRDMKRLLELKAQPPTNVSAEASASAPAAGATSDPTSVVEPKSLAADIGAGNPAAAIPVEAASPIQAAPAAAVPTRTATSAAQDEPVEDSWLGSSLFLGGIAAALAGAVTLLLFRRKRRVPQEAAEEFAAEPMPDTPTVPESVASVLRNSEESDAALAEDPLAEAEWYLACDRREQAEQVLKEALTHNPERQELHMKLLEMYSATRNVAAFEAVARQLHWATGGEAGTAWDQAAAMGAALDPQNSLYGGVTTDSPAPAAATAADVISESAVFDATGAQLRADQVQSGILEFAPVGESVASNPKIGGERGDAQTRADEFTPEGTMILNDQPWSGVDLDLGEAKPGEPAKAVDFSVAAEETKSRDLVASHFMLDLDAIETVNPSQASHANVLSFENVDLNFGDAPVEEARDAMQDDERWQDVETKLDLARAYQEMGETQGAREILEEVIKEGHAKQQDAARSLLAALG